MNTTRAQRRQLERDNAKQPDFEYILVGNDADDATDAAATC